MSIVNATTARNRFFKLIEETIATNDVVTITSKPGNIVMLPEADYCAMQETLYLCSIPGMREKIVQGLNAPEETFVEDIDE